MERLQMNTVVSVDLTLCEGPKLLQRFARLRILRAEVRGADYPGPESAAELYCKVHMVDKNGRKVATHTADCKTGVVKVFMYVCMYVCMYAPM